MSNSSLPETITLSRIEYQTLMRALALAVKRAEESLTFATCRICQTNVAAVCAVCEHKNQDSVEQYMTRAIGAKVRKIAETMRESVRGESDFPSMSKAVILTWANDLEKAAL